MSIDATMISNEPVKMIQPDNLTEVESEGKTYVQVKRRNEPEREDLTEPENEHSVIGRDDKTVIYNISHEGDIKNLGLAKDSMIKIVSDKNLQVCPENFHNFNQDLRIFSQHNDDNHSQYVSRKIEKLHNNSDRREKAKSSKNLTGLKKSSKHSSGKKSSKKPRYKNMNVFDYEDVSHPASNNDQSSHNSEERKMTPNTVHTRPVINNQKIEDNSVPQPETEKGCLDKYPPSTPSAYSVAIQASEFNKSQGIQANQSTIENQVQADMHLYDESEAENEKLIQCDMTEIDSKVDDGMIEQAVSASMDTIGSNIREREIEIVDHGNVGIQADIDNPNAVDF